MVAMSGKMVDDPRYEKAMEYYKKGEHKKAEKTYPGFHRSLKRGKK